MNRIQEISRQIVRGELIVALDQPPLPWPRPRRAPRARPAGRHAAVKPSRNSATFGPSDASA